MTNATGISLVATAVLFIAALAWSTLLLAACVAAVGLLMSGALWYGVHHPPRVA